MRLLGKKQLSRFVLLNNLGVKIADFTLNTNFPTIAGGSAGFSSFETIASPTTGYVILEVDSMGFGILKNSHKSKYTL